MLIHKCGHLVLLPKLNFAQADQILVFEILLQSSFHSRGHWSFGSTTDWVTQSSLSQVKNQAISQPRATGRTTPNAVFQQAHLEAARMLSWMMEQQDHHFLKENLEGYKRNTHSEGQTNHLADLCTKPLFHSHLLSTKYIRKRESNKQTD